MLAAGSTADVRPMVETLGWSSRDLAIALAAEPAVLGDLALARLLPLRSVLLGTLAIIWLGSGLASFLVSPDRADTLLAGLGLAGRSALVVTWAGATTDVVLGGALLFSAWRRRVLATQLAVMGTYTVLATVALPGLWADPFGALLKNLAVLALTLILLAIEV